MEQTKYFQVKIPPEETSAKKRSVGGRNWKDIARESRNQLSGSGGLLVKSLHFDHDIDEPLALVHKTPFALNKSRVEETSHAASNHVAIQTEEEVEVKESVGRYWQS